MGAAATAKFEFGRTSQLNLLCADSCLDDESLPAKISTSLEGNIRDEGQG